MQPLRRTLHPEVKVLDSRQGLCAYIASDESLDNFSEVIKASGWRFRHFAQNAPFVDSHDYATIEKCVGKVVDFQVQNGRLVETVQWAVDIAENKLAQLGWKMTEAGYLKAVSVGFLPTKCLTPNSGEAWRSQLRELGLKDNGRVRAIYTEQEQLELSACIIGANPNAVACAYHDGILRDSDLERWPQFRRALAAAAPVSARTFSFASSALRTAGSPVERLLAEPGKRQFWNAAARHLTRQELSPSDAALMKSLTPAPNTFGAALLPAEMAQDVFDLLLTYGAFRTLGVRAMPGPFTKFAKITGLPGAVFITPNAVSNSLPADSSFAGASVTPEANIIGSLIEASLFLLEDAAVDFAALLLEKFSQAIAARLDYACFQGNGANDQANGAQTGIFVDSSIPAVTATTGNTTVNQLERQDFLNVTAAVAPAALQRPCRWWIHPGFLPILSQLKDGDGNTYLLRGPDITGSEWFLCGFPVTWTAQAPAANQPGAKIAAFGDGESYLVAVRQELAIAASPHSGFNVATKQLRAYARAVCLTREASGLATLALASH
ncbi:MAG TPA: phage major capsid protein [Verrucomicrobiae bacterium]|jgi:HK97 family phage major capsid protein|nr:phage major capsid protein [Verrucomicrobiae bacterium]